MDSNISLSSDGKVKFSLGSGRVRLEDLNKWLGRNDDAVLVKLEGRPINYTKYRVGHICTIIENDDSQKYDVLIGNHVIGQLPEEAIAFAKQVDSSPEFLIAIVGKIEYGASSADDDIFIYIAE